MKSLYLIGLLFALSSTSYAQMFTRNQVIMGTIATITLEDKSFIQKGFRLLYEVEHALSSYNKEAKLYKLNHQKEIYHDKYLLEVLQKSKYFYKLTHGYFDISIGSVTKEVYHFGQEQASDLKALQRAKIDINAFAITDTKVTLEKGITLDLGGIGKGYGVDVVSDYYHDKNITQGKVAISGDIRCLDLCEFSIQSPFEKGKTILTFSSKIPNLSISTSGTYERFKKSKELHHLINPKTKKQGRAFVSVTIMIEADNTQADALATAVSVMPKEEAIQFLLAQDVGFILVEPDKTRWSANLEKFVTSK